MTTPEDFEQELAARLEQAGDAVAGEGATLDGVIVRHRQRVRARRARQGAAAAVAAGVLAVAGIGLATDGDGGTTQLAAEGSPATDAPTTPPGLDACGGEADVIVFLRPQASEEQTQAVAQVLEGRFGPAAVHFVSQEDAYEEAQALFADQPTALGILQLEDVPASFRVAVAGSGLEVASLRDEVRELVSGMEVRSVEAVDGEIVSIETGVAPGAEGAPSSESTTTTDPSLAGGLLTEEQVQALVAYIRGLDAKGELRGEVASPGPCIDDDAPTAGTVPPSSSETTAPPPAPSTGEAPGSGSPTTDAPTSTTIPAWPAGTTPQHGGQVWAAYLAVVPEAEGSTAPDLRRAGDQARALGYETGPSDLACDQGAVEALGLPAGSYLGLPLYFASEAEARSFAERFRSEVRGEVRGVAEVQTFCLD